MLFSCLLSGILPAGISSVALTQITRSVSGTVLYQSGVSKSSFTTPKGNVSVLLPQDLSGKVLTGTVSVEPTGKNEKEKKKNLNDLLKWSVSIAGQRISLSDMPKQFVWQTHNGGGLRSPVALWNAAGVKEAELNLPPVISSPAVDPNSPLQLTTPRALLVKGDLLNMHTNKGFTAGGNFLITDSKGQKFTVKPVCQSAQHAVISLPDEVALGELTVIEEVFDSPINGYNPAQSKLSLVDLEISSPKTNLTPGETSEVIVAIVTDTKGEWINPDIDKLITGQMSINLRNLAPQTVSMQGGNYQQVHFPVYARPGRLEIRRNIVANTAGAFSVSVTLNPDFAISNDPFSPQLNALQTPDEFNSWTAALKSDLRHLASLQNGDAASGVLRSNVQRAIDNLPRCTDQGNLPECKAVATSLLRPLDVPKGAASTWLSGYEVFKTAAAQLNSPLAIPETELMRNGLEIIKRFIFQQKIGHMLSELNQAKQLLDLGEKAGFTPGQRSQLSRMLQSLITAVDPVARPGMWDKKLLAYETYCLEKRTKDGIDPKESMIAFLDPGKKRLWVNPEYQQQVLATLKAVPAGNEMFQIQSLSAMKVPVSYLIRAVPMFMHSVYDHEWWANELMERKTRDSTAGTRITATKDSTGTYWVFYKNAKCEKMEGQKRQKCLEHETCVWDPKTQKGELKKDGKYYTYEFLPVGSCKKGTEFCTEMWSIFRINYVYADKNCTRLVDVEKIYGFSCL